MKSKISLAFKNCKKENRTALITYTVAGENTKNNSLKIYPRNLLLNQYKFDLEKTKAGFYFDCNNVSHIAAEILFISASALSSQSLYYSSNFYLWQLRI